MQKAFSEIVKQWYEKFLSLDPGQCVDIEKSGKRDKALFIDMCKDFIDDGHPEYEFTEDYKYFKRTFITPF